MRHHCHWCDRPVDAEGNPTGPPEPGAARMASHRTCKECTARQNAEIEERKKQSPLTRYQLRRAQNFGRIKLADMTPAERAEWERVRDAKDAAKLEKRREKQQAEKDRRGGMTHEEEQRHLAAQREEQQRRDNAAIARREAIREEGRRRERQQRQPKRRGARR